MNGPGLDSNREALPQQELHCLKGHDGPVLAVRFNTAGTYCLSCGKVFAAALLLPCMVTCIASLHSLGLMPMRQDRSIRLWNPHRGILIKTYNGAALAA